MAATKRILIATGIAGTLDILAAMILSISAGGTVRGMLRSVGSGPFPAAREMGMAGAAIGLATHFMLMAIMATVFVLAADRLAALKRQPLIWGALYGIGIWLVMYFLVLPTRFGAPIPHDPIAIAKQLFCHIVLVGWPIALTARRG
ncbi:MAG: hypothetical protein KF730_05215 [Sphingomonas sp.]|uniref:hypothetical protein n=1 Tax=Sphingomonas sp. TaxID=28214 RepID=UPI0025CDC72D|nr:hypothetical protein [Sphingomonas sp.]MBX3563962.1 hypothetical protein [Sphingomonas sp.]